MTTFIVMILNFVLNNSVNLSRPPSARMDVLGRLAHVLSGLRIGCGGQRSHLERSVPSRRSVGAGGAYRTCMFSAVWNYGVTSMTTWRQARRSSEQRAMRRIEATAGGDTGRAEWRHEMPAKTYVIRALARVATPLPPHTPHTNE